MILLDFCWPRFILSGIWNFHTITTTSYPMRLRLTIFEFCLCSHMPVMNRLHSKSQKNTQVMGWQKYALSAAFFVFFCKHIFLTSSSFYVYSVSWSGGMLTCLGAFSWHLLSIQRYAILLDFCWKRIILSGIWNFHTITTPSYPMRPRLTIFEFCLCCELAAKILKGALDGQNEAIVPPTFRSFSREFFTIWR